MRRLWMVIVVLAAACAEQPQTYRELDRIGQEYERQAITGQPENAEQATARDSCGASRFRALIGTEADQIDRATLPPRTRVITPDMMVTQDFSPARLNIMVGADGKVGSLGCY